MLVLWINQDVWNVKFKIFNFGLQVYRQEFGKLLILKRHWLHSLKGMHYLAEERLILRFLCLKSLSSLLLFLNLNVTNQDTQKQGVAAGVQGVLPHSNLEIEIWMKKSLDHPKNWKCMGKILPLSLKGRNTLLKFLTIPLHSSQ